MPRKKSKTEKNQKPKRKRKSKQNNTQKKSNRKGTHLKDVLSIPGLSSQITKHLPISNTKEFMKVSKQIKDNKYIQKELYTRKDEFTNEIIDNILQRVSFINEIPYINFDGYMMYELHSFVSDFHFDDEGDKSEMRSNYEDYDSDDSSTADDYKVDKYRDDYIMLMHYVYTTPHSEFIIYCPHFNKSDLQTLNAKSLSNTKSYERFEKVFKKHMTHSEFRIYHFIGDNDSQKGDYIRLKPFEFKKVFHMIA